MPRNLPDPIMACRFFQSADITELEEALSQHDTHSTVSADPSPRASWFDLFDEPTSANSSVSRGGRARLRLPTLDER
jgi:hypothetical protein